MRVVSKKDGCVQFEAEYNEKAIKDFSLEKWERWSYKASCSYKIEIHQYVGILTLAMFPDCTKYGLLYVLAADYL